MLENLNLSLFSLINATPDSAPWMISLAIFIAKDLITVVPLLAVVLTPKSWTVKHEAYRSDSDIQLESDLLISG